MSAHAIRIFVAGPNGMVGSALVLFLSTTPANEISTAKRSELDLLNQAAVNAFFCTWPV
jgi:GDP-L-fucose synthase